MVRTPIYLPDTDFVWCSSHPQPSRRRTKAGRFWLLCLQVLLLCAASTFPAAGQILYSDFGPNNSFSTQTGGWCVSGPSGADCTTLATRWIAASFTPSSTAALSTVSLALSYLSGTNGVVISLMGNAEGAPGSIIESWTVSNLPSSSAPTITTVTSVVKPTLQVGQTYWLEVQALASNTMAFWYSNNLGLSGGLQNINQTSWIPLSAQTLPAFSVVGAATNVQNPTGSSIQVSPNPSSVGLILGTSTVVPFTVTTSNSGSTIIQVSSDVPWLNPLQNNLVINGQGQVYVAVDGTTLSTGTYNGNLTFSCANNGCASVKVPVTLTVVQGLVQEQISAPMSITFSVSAGQQAQQNLHVIATPSQTMVQVSPSANFLSVSSASPCAQISSPACGNAPGDFTITLDASSLSVGSQQQSLTLQCVYPSSCLPVNVTVDIDVTATSTQLFPHIADGGEYQTDFLLINPTSNPVTVSMVFHLDNGVPTLPIIGLGAVPNIPNISLPPLGSVLYRTAGFSNAPTVSGWVEVDSQVAINGQALFRRYASDGRYYEGSVPLTTASQSFTLPYDGSTYPGGASPPIATLLTGIALANPNPIAATVNCSAYDPNGVLQGGTSFQAVTLASLAHTAAVLQTTPPYASVVGTGRGILVCNSNEAVGVIGLRFFGSEALSSLPVSSVGSSKSNVTQLFPHIADGGEYQTDFLLINPTSNTITVSMVFHLDNGVPTLPIIGLEAVASINNISLPPLGSTLYRTAGFSNASTVSGWVEVDSPVAINGQALFRRYASDGGYYEGSVPLAIPTNSFALPFDGSVYPGNGAPPNVTILTGIALANPLAVTGPAINCTGYDPNGNSLGNLFVGLSGLGHTAAVLESSPPYAGVVGNGRGILVCNSTDSIGVIGLRFFGDYALSSLPVITGN